MRPGLLKFPILISLALVLVLSAEIGVRIAVCGYSSSVAMVGIAESIRRAYEHGNLL
jgi:hypothetical protein